MRNCLLIALLGLTLTCGCTTVGEPHTWLVVHDASKCPGLATFLRLSDERVGPVSPAHTEEAVKLLDQTPWVEVTSEEAHRLCDADALQNSANMRAFLVRGVGFGRSAVVVARRPSDGALWVDEISYRGELFVPFDRWSMVPSPVVVLLPAPPSAIYLRAICGGDGVLSYLRYWPKEKP